MEFEIGFPLQQSKRRRVDIACARCRKRKIRCSGDPGDGTGCQACNFAGVDPILCTFHRVDSGEATSIIKLHNLSLANANSHDKSVYYQSRYNSPYTSKETSPVDTYGLDQPNGYLPNQNTIACNGNYNWTTDNKSALTNFMGQDCTLFRTQALASIRPQLPIPQPAQKSRNVVDQLQDQRLQSAQAMGRNSFSSGSFVKPLLSFNGYTGVPVTASTKVLAAQNTPASSADNATCYPTIAPMNTVDIPVSTGSSFTFSTSPLFDAMIAPAQPTYSNFRDSQDYKSQTDLYRIGNSSNSGGSLGGNASTLVSGNQYTPLSHSHSHHQVKSEKPIYPAHQTPKANQSF